jgi:hypothetical protein
MCYNTRTGAYYSQEMRHHNLHCFAQGKCSKVHRVQTVISELCWLLSDYVTLHRASVVRSTGANNTILVDNLYTINQLSVINYKN